MKTDTHTEILPRSISKRFGALCLFMLATIIAQYRCIVNENAIVLLTTNQKYYGVIIFITDQCAHMPLPASHFSIC